jgi:hypothetical protein
MIVALISFFSGKTSIPLFYLFCFFEKNRLILRLSDTTFSWLLERIVSFQRCVDRALSGQTSILLQTLPLVAGGAVEAAATRHHSLLVIRLSVRDRRGDLVAVKLEHAAHGAAQLVVPPRVVIAPAGRRRPVAVQRYRSDGVRIKQHRHRRADTSTCVGDPAAVDRDSDSELACCTSASMHDASGSKQPRHQAGSAIHMSARDATVVMRVVVTYQWGWGK